MMTQISLLRVWLLSFTLLFLIIAVNVFDDDLVVFSQSTSSSYMDKNANSWISKRDNLNITMSLTPKVPVIDEKTKIAFEVKKLNNSGIFDNLYARVTITDHDGRLFKFSNQPVLNGKFLVEYIFPDDGQHKTIVQLYKNTTAFALAYFDITVPHPQPPDNIFSWLFKSRPF